MIESDPKPLWSYFEKISKIPRCSKKEEKIGDYLLAVANEHGLEFQRDKAGNIVIRKPATTNPNAPTTILQAHMDMVCEKNEDVEHNFAEDPIPLKREGDWLTAEGTTLGADNGIGVAACLAIATDDNLEHGPLELLLTVDEETGLTGASNIRKDFLEGKKLINLDSEEIGVFTIGCAGGGNSKIHLPTETKTHENPELIEIKVTGLKGGHSGVDIDKGRANSIKVLGQLLWNLEHKLEGKILLHDLAGGDKHNAIPREARAILAVFDSKEKAVEIIQNGFEKIENEYRKIEPEMKIEIERKSKKNDEIKLFTSNSSKKAIDLVQALPNGVLAMSQKIQGLVKTSTNLASVSKGDGKLKVIMSTRSSAISELEATRDQIRGIAESFGAKVNEDEAYPGWVPNPNSKLLEVFKRAYMDIFKEEPKTKAVHAGLETGVIGEKFEDMDMISIGPEIRNPHSPDEKVNIESVQNFWNLLIRSLEILAE